MVWGQGKQVYISELYKKAQFSLWWYHLHYSTTISWFPPLLMPSTYTSWLFLLPRRGSPSRVSTSRTVTCCWHHKPTLIIYNVSRVTPKYCSSLPMLQTLMSTDKFQNTTGSTQPHSCICFILWFTEVFICTHSPVPKNKSIVMFSREQRQAWSNTTPVIF